MSGSWPSHELPYLNDISCDVTSKVTRRYNCIAWAAKENFRNWWPDPMGIGYWPIAKREETMEAFVEAFQTLGYSICLNESLEEELEKIALYGIKEKNKDAIPTHAALQLTNGKWTSKLGPFEDIIHHTLDAVNGPVYGRALVIMSRPRLISSPDLI